MIYLTSTLNIRYKACELSTNMNNAEHANKCMPMTYLMSKSTKSRKHNKVTEKHRDTQSKKQCVNMRNANQVGQTN